MFPPVAGAANGQQVRRVVGSAIADGGYVVYLLGDGYGVAPQARYAEGLRVEDASADFEPAAVVAPLVPASPAVLQPRRRGQGAGRPECRGHVRHGSLATVRAPKQKRRKQGGGHLFAPWLFGLRGADQASTPGLSVSTV